ncbi:hypothetical protein GcM1_168003 [Golovinomyces cichoracearum]|uniref:Uncharacterized protein n=1 Tax=Golovinomyces cichoracearum TaxID=62708 RepID=A0A420J7C2_9PEZI|nr:hypothetical protein GcM1_168003 [Golovinomyces cichoracearum]
MRREMATQIIQASRAEVVIREDVIESHNDPRPNAFFDSKTGILRVYHGPVYGNPLATLIPTKAPQIGSFVSPQTMNELSPFVTNSPPIIPRDAGSFYTCSNVNSLGTNLGRENKFSPFNNGQPIPINSNRLQTQYPFGENRGSTSTLAQFATSENVYGTAGDEISNEQGGNYPPGNTKHLSRNNERERWNTSHAQAQELSKGSVDSSSANNKPSCRTNHSKHSDSGQVPTHETAGISLGASGAKLPSLNFNKKEAEQTVTENSTQENNWESQKENTCSEVW